MSPGKRRRGEVRERSTTALSSVAPSVFRELVPTAYIERIYVGAQGREVKVVPAWVKRLGACFRYRSSKGYRWAMVLAFDACARNDALVAALETAHLAGGIHAVFNLIESLPGGREARERAARQIAGG